jgi:hypothetical protein
MPNMKETHDNQTQKMGNQRTQRAQSVTVSPVNNQSQQIDNVTPQSGTVLPVKEPQKTYSLSTQSKTVSPVKSKSQQMNNLPTQSRLTSKQDGTRSKNDSSQTHDKDYQPAVYKSQHIPVDDINPNQELYSNSSLSTHKPQPADTDISHLQVTKNTSKEEIPFLAQDLSLKAPDPLSTLLPSM